MDGRDDSDASTEGEHFHHSDDESGSGQQDGRQDVAAEGASVGSSSRIEITSMEELSNAINLGKLSQVEVIDLDDPDVGSGHFTVAKALASGEMSALRLLMLEGTGLEDDRSEAIGNALASAKFPSLTTIHFSWCEIGTKGVEALGRAIQSGNLEKLAGLWLRRTGIDDADMATLATAFQYGDASVLPNFKRLNLEYNRFSEVGLQSLAEALKSGRLDSLEVLLVKESSNPSQEGAAALVSAFALNNSLTAFVAFEWAEFPELERQYEQLRNRNMRYEDFLAGLSGSSMVPAAFGKIYLCGDPKTGKTTLSHTLKRSFWRSLWTWETSPHVETRTRGIDVSKILIKGGQRKNENPQTLWIWDMAGQQDYHLVHNAFFPALSFSDRKGTTSQGTATIFVIVCNSQSPPHEVEKQLDYWLRYIASSYHEATKQIRDVFVVLNNMGGVKEVQKTCQYWKVLLQEKRDKFSGLLDVRTDTFLVDVRRRGKVDRFKTCLTERSKQLLENQKVPDICDLIQRSLSIWSEARKEFPVLGWEEFVKKVQEFCKDWPEQIISSATKYLDESGVLIYVNKSHLGQRGIPSECLTIPKWLIILDPNWFCKEIIGNMFLSEDMVKPTEGNQIFRKNLDATTGSISRSAFKTFFKTRWAEKDCEDMIVILVWLGLCYEGKDNKVFIPSLIDVNLEPADVWQSHSKHEDGEEQWVMGFSIQHQENEMTLAPMSLWHRFQVKLAQSPKFNNAGVPNSDAEFNDGGVPNSEPEFNNAGVPESEFVAGKYFMTFTVDYMNVRIEVNAGKDSPTFDDISIFVKPPLRKDKMDIIQMKQLQVNLADDLVNILLELWTEVCGGVKYEQKVVWPWPVSQSRRVYKKDRNMEVAEVKKWVLMHGMGRRMQWPVGRDSAITEDQLLSTKDKEYVMIMSAKNDINVLRQGMQEAVNLGIYPPELIQVTEESEVSLDENEMEKAAQGSDEIKMATPPASPTAKKLHTLLTAKDKILNKMETLKKVKNVERTLREELAEVLNEQKRVLHKLQDTQRFFKEDKDRTCPNLIYLGKSGARGSGVRATLKESLSPTVNVCLQFACEAMYDSYRPHQVKDQQGLVLSERKPSLQIVPWLTVSLTVLLISAKIGTDKFRTDVVAPGAGLLLPDFQQLQQGKSLLDGIVWATGYSMQDLDNLITEGMGLHPTVPPLNPRDVYGKSRAALTNLIGKLSKEACEEKFGLRKVCLADTDCSRGRSVWICADCYEKFMESKLVTDM